VRSHSLIIPVICRGWKDFPVLLRKERLAHNFEPLLLRRDRVTKTQEGRVELANIARYIVDRVRELQAIPDDLCQHCSNFSLPPVNEIIPWVRDLQKNPQSYQQPLLPSRTS
jgi:hypothetical protein